MKKIRLVLILAFFAFSSVSCGSSGTRQESRPADSGQSCSSYDSRPDWANASVIDERDRVVFVGSSVTESDREKSKQSAIDNVLGNVSKYFGVSVSATFSEKRSKINGKRDSEIVSKNYLTSRKIDIQEYSYEGNPVVICTGSGYVTYVKVAVPKRELARIKIELDHFGVWAIKSDVPKCEEKIRDLFPVFGRYGIHINEQIDYSSKTPDQVFAENKKAFYLKLECSETKSEEYSGEFYSMIQISVELFNLMNGETINRWKSEGKGGAYSREDARDTGISKALNEIIDQIN